MNVLAEIQGLKFLVGASHQSLFNASAGLLLIDNLQRDLEELLEELFVSPLENEKDRRWIGTNLGRKNDAASRYPVQDFGPGQGQLFFVISH